jgi:hypothetical protein
MTHRLILRLISDSLEGQLSPKMLRAQAKVGKATRERHDFIYLQNNFGRVVQPGQCRQIVGAYVGASMSRYEKGKSTRGLHLECSITRNNLIPLSPSFVRQTIPFHQRIAPQHITGSISKLYHASR